MQKRNSGVEAYIHTSNSPDTASAWSLLSPIIARPPHRPLTRSLAQSTNMHTYLPPARTPLQDEVSAARNLQGGWPPHWPISERLSHQIADHRLSVAACPRLTGGGVPPVRGGTSASVGESRLPRARRPFRPVWALPRHCRGRLRPPLTWRDLSILPPPPICLHFGFGCASMRAAFLFPPPLFATTGSGASRTAPRALDGQWVAAPPARRRRRRSGCGSGSGGGSGSGSSTRGGSGGGGGGDIVAMAPDAHPPTPPPTCPPVAGVVPAAAIAAGGVGLAIDAAGTATFVRAAAAVATARLVGAGVSGGVTRSPTPGGRGGGMTWTWGGGGGGDSHPGGGGGGRGGGRVAGGGVCTGGACGRWGGRWGGGPCR